jgi:hypothetical protein
MFIFEKREKMDLQTSKIELLKMIVNINNEKQFVNY